MSVYVRTAKLEEAGAVAEVAARTFALACPPTAAPSDISAFIDASLTAQSFAGYIADPQRQVAIAIVDGSVVGYTMLIFDPPADDIARQLTTTSTAELSKIYVDPSLHGRAVGSLLFDDAVTRVRTAGRAAVWLGTNQANQRAQRFYEKSGFVRVGDKRFLLGSHWEDDFIYELVLSPGP
jgi:ribosomal protein S18 acetylase RimI-like enzyme